MQSITDFLLRLAGGNPIAYNSNEDKWIYIVIEFHILIFIFLSFLLALFPWLFFLIKRYQVTKKSVLLTTIISILIFGMTFAALYVGMWVLFGYGVRSIY